MSSMQQHQPTWNPEYGMYLQTVWNDHYGRWYWTHHVEDQGWVFFDWIPLESPQRVDSSNARTRVAAAYGDSAVRYGNEIKGDYNPEDPKSTPWDALDRRFFVRPSVFFTEGRVFSVLFTEAAGANTLNSVTNYNSSLSTVKYNELVHTQVRRFVVVKRKREFCYALPIFTYGNRATTKSGVIPDEHAIIYSHGYQPQLIPGETPLIKEPICMVMAEGEAPLPAASRIYFAIHHPVQYNVKVKDLGHIHPEWLAKFLGYWAMENDSGWQRPAELAASTYPPQTSASDFEEVRNPHNFFKIARVFMTPWTEPDGISGQPFTKTARFVVVKPGPTFSVCLRISTYSGQATTKPGVVAHQHAAVIPQGGRVIEHKDGEYLSKDPIEVKVENEEVGINTMSRINFAKPYTIEHRVKVRNVGRVVGDSVKRLEQYFAESMGFTKPSPDNA